GGRRRRAGGVGRARGAQPRPEQGRRPPGSALRARSVEPAVVLDRWKRGHQLGRPALPVVRRHERPCAGRRGVPPRRLARDAGRPLLWKGRKSAFGAIARIAPNYYLHDAVVPRTRLVEVMRSVYDIAKRYDLVMMNVFHAGDGNLHPLIVFDRRAEGVLERVMAAGEE